MKKIKLIYISVFLVCIFLVPTLTVLGPNSGTSFYEQRSLASVPQLTWSGVWNGSFFSGLETALTDHIVLRDEMMKSYTRLNMILNRPVTNNLIVNSDVLLDNFGFYYWDISYIDDQANSMAQEYSALNELIKSYGGSFYFLGVPQQSIYFADHYPDYMDNRLWHTTAIRTAFAKYMSQYNVPFIDMYAEYQAFGSPADFYYKTDHHFTYKGAYAAYDVLLEAINKKTDFDMPIMAEEDLEWSVLPNPFLGSANRKIYRLWPNDDMFELARPKQNISFSRFDNGNLVDSSVYALPDDDKEDVTYSAYMGGDIGETMIQTNRPNLKNALIFGDSYTNPLETLLWTGFNETRSLDYRYYDGKALRAYIEDYQPDVVITVRDESVYLVGEGNGRITE